MNFNKESEKREEVRLKSPEKLGAYMHAVRPSVWGILLAITILLIGFFYWAAYGEIEISITTMAYVDDDNVMCWVEYADAMDIHPGMKVICNSTKGTVVRIDGKGMNIRDIAEDVGDYNIQAMMIRDNEVYYRVDIKLEEVLHDGVEDVKIIEREITPGEYILNYRGGEWE